MDQATLAKVREVKIEVAKFHQVRKRELEAMEKECEREADLFSCASSTCDAEPKTTAQQVALSEEDRKARHDAVLEEYGKHYIYRGYRVSWADLTSIVQFAMTAQF